MNEQNQEQQTLMAKLHKSEIAIGIVVWIITLQ